MDNVSIHADTITEAFNDVLDSIKAIQYIHMNNPVIENSIFNISTENGMSTLKNIAQTAVESNPYIYSVTYINHLGDMISSDSYTEDITLSKLHSLLDDRHGIPFIDSLSYARHNYGFQKVIPVYKEMYGENGKSIGYIIIYLDFTSLIAEINRYSDTALHMLLFDKNGTNIYISNHHDLYTISPSDIKVREFKRTSYNNKEYFIYDCKHLSFYGTYNNRLEWYIMLGYLPSKYNPITDSSTLIYILLILVFTFLMVLTAQILSHNFSKNITLLVDMLKHSNGINLEKIDNSQINDNEINDIIVCYNNMVDRLQNSLNNEYRSTIQKQELRLKMLSYQINPHFLYNCFNLISSLAIIHNVPYISNVSHILGNMYRYTLGNDDIVTIGDEVSQMMDYIEIQKIRYNNAFDIDIDISASLFDCPCMKFILQPIIENSFSHGLFKQNEPDNQTVISKRAKIDLVIYEHNNTIFFMCTDNGIGIDETTLMEIRKQLNASFDDPHDSIGLWNIHQRIKTFYGESYGLNIESVVNQYTTVTLTYPVS